MRATEREVREAEGEVRMMPTFGIPHMSATCIVNMMNDPFPSP